MKVPNDEDLANHVSPESCGGCGNKTAEALTGENAGGQLSSEITTARVPTLLLGGEGNIRRSAKRELRRNPAESENLACVEASWARIERSVNLPVFKSWNGRIQPVKISWCTRRRSYPVQAKKEDTKQERSYRVGWGRSKSPSPPQKGSRKSDNNIVPEKQTNKGKYRPGGVCGGKDVD
jgi:hypothetical protein